MIQFYERKRFLRKIPMLNDPIVAEVRKTRDEHAAKFNYDLAAIYRDLKECERASGRKYVRFAPRRIEPEVVKAVPTR